MAEGTAVAGRYLLDRLAGRGGMGEVYRARDTATGSLVAVKLLTPQSHARAARMNERFAREARTLRALEDPAIVRYVDDGLHEGNRPFLVMEWLEAQPLDAVLQTRGLSAADVLTLAIRLLGALRYLNGLGVIHRDLKPANVMLVDGRPELAKLVDFGIARAGFESLTRTGHMVGTPFYMAPEQVRNARGVDGRADVFSLGAVLYECLTGQLPFPAGDAISFIARLSAGEARPVITVRPSVPSTLSELVARLLVRDRERRPYADAQLEAAFASLRDGDHDWQGLGPVLTRRPVHATTADSEPTDVDGGVGSAPTDAQSEGTRADRSRAGEPGLRTMRSSFVGRARELGVVSREIADQGAGVVVWGLPGIGKSRLASEASGLFVQEQPAVRVALALDVSSVDSGDDLIRLLCTRLGARPEATLGHRSALTNLGRMLRARGEPVIALDGAEGKAAILAELVESWRSGDIGARFVVTSRERLALEGLSDLELGPLSSASHEGALSDAALLLLERAGMLAREHTVSEREAANRIAGALDGNPLAIELAAARVAMVGLTVEALSTDSPVELLGGANSRSARPLLDALAQAVERLSPEEQRALAESTLFHGGFTVQAAQVVLTAEPHIVLLDVLQRLRERSLIRPHQSSEKGAVRFFMPRAVREFAQEQLSESQLAAVRERRNAYFLATCGVLASEVERTGATSALVQLTAEAENLLAVVHDALAASDCGETALAALLAYDPIPALRGPIAPHLLLLERALGLVDASSLLAARGKQARGRHLVLLDRYDEARADLEAALRVAEQQGAEELKASVRLDLGVLDHRAQRYDGARRWYEAALVIESGHDHPNPRVEARALANLAALAYDERDTDAAIERYEEALAVLEAIADERQLALTSMNLAVLLQETGERKSAREHYQRAVACFERLGDARLSGIALSNFGMLELEDSELEAAVRSQQKAQRLLAQSGDERSEALCWGRLGASLSASGDVRGAIVAFRKADRMTARRDLAARQTVRVYGAFLDLARARQAQQGGRITQADQALHAAFARIREADHPSDDGTPPVSTHSDDVRTALRVLHGQISAFEVARPTSQ